MPSNTSKTTARKAKVVAKKSASKTSAKSSPKAATKASGASKLVVPTGRKALDTIQAAHLTVEALQLLSEPTPNARMFETTALDRDRFPTPSVVPLLRPFNPTRFAARLRARLDSQNVGYAFQVNG